MLGTASWSASGILACEWACHASDCLPPPPSSRQGGLGEFECTVANLCFEQKTKFVLSSLVSKGPLLDIIITALRGEHLGGSFGNL